jgi:hypothetical protein
MTGLDENIVGTCRIRAAPFVITVTPAPGRPNPEDDP